MSDNRDRRSLSRGENPLVRAIGRVPTTVQRKLLTALALMAILLVAVGVLGLVALNASNDRVATLGQLPPRVVYYEELQLNSQQLWADLVARDGIVIPCEGQERCASVDLALLGATDSDINAALIQVEPLSEVAELRKLGVEPTASETGQLAHINSEFAQILGAMPGLITQDTAGSFIDSDNEVQAQTAADLLARAGALVTATKTNAARLSAQNESDDLASQHLFIGVAAGSVVLALLVGLALSRSLIGPIRKMDTRLAAIASGDFSGHVDVSNRDELGALAANSTGMNDEIGRLYAELETASQHKSEFLANMSHELRTPLNAVIGFSEVLEGQALRRAQRETGRVRRRYPLVGATPADADQRHPRPLEDRSRSDGSAADAVRTLRRRAELRGTDCASARPRQSIALTLDVDPSVGVVDADERKMKQVLFNLLTNALKFTPRGGHVVVSARGDGDEGLISVRDDGVGIAPVDPGPDLRGVPAGRDVPSPGGNRTWASPSRDASLNFTVGASPSRASSAGQHIHGHTCRGIRAPRERLTPTRRALRGQGLVARATAQPGMTTLADGQLVLIIEDNEKNLKLARDLLQYHGFRTIEAAGCRDGHSDGSRSSAPDVILMDIELPGMDGVTALGELARRSGTAGMVVVAFTASVMPVDRDRFSRAGIRRDDRQAHRHQGVSRSGTRILHSLDRR